MKTLLLVALAAASLLSTACVYPGGWFSTIAYHAGITRIEGFQEPKRVWVSRADGAVAIDADAFLYTPAEGRETRSRKWRHDIPFWARFSERPMHRRFIYASGDVMEDLVASEASRSRIDPSRPEDELDIRIYLHPLQKAGDAPSWQRDWQVLPSDFDAPDAADADLPIDRSGGYAIIPWQRSVAFETNDRGRRQYYYAWKQPVVWRSRDGRSWRLSFYLMVYQDAARHEHPPNPLDWFMPVLWTLDIATSPVQIPVDVILYGFFP